MDRRKGCSSSPVGPAPPLWEVYAELCGSRLFRRQVAWQEHARVVRYLARADCAREAAWELRRLVAHHLFASARRLGRRNALADPRRALKLLVRNTLPAAAVVQEQTAGLTKLHLGGFEPEARLILRHWVLRRADTLRRAFFEPRPDSDRAALWGERFVAAPGDDWFQQCLGTMSKGSVRAVCQGDLLALSDRVDRLAL